MAQALNRLLTTVRWENDEGRLCDFDNNVALARAVSEIRGHTPHTYVHKVRQGHITDPRVSFIWAVCLVLTEHTAPDVTITPDYFFVPEVKAPLDRVLDLHLYALMSRRSSPL